MDRKGEIKEAIELKSEAAKKIEREPHPLLNPKLTPGQKASDTLTYWMGSWFFIILFLLFLFFWMLVNIYAWINTWDPYPFILLNLVLSTLAAIQAPLILMSQNREAQKDRLRSEYDYAINRKAAREVDDIQKQLDRIERKINSKHK